jgi:malate dehydrogenase (oxaloacetate-decarboxylating)
VVSDGSHVLGLGNVGPLASLPSLEGKCALLAQLGGVNAMPVAIDTQDAHKIVEIVKGISPGLGAVMLEDIEFPKCDIITQRLEKELRIPVFHNDTQITATVVLAALTNALKVVRKKLEKTRIVILGAGVAGAAIARMLHAAGAESLVVCDIRGPIFNKRPNMNVGTNQLVEDCHLSKRSGSIEDVVKKADVLIGVTKNGKITESMIASMAKDPVVFALSRPQPEITPAEAYKAGARVVATGLYEYANHIDNAIIFPGLIRALLGSGMNDLPQALFLEIAKAVAGLVKKPSEKEIIPDVFEKKLLEAIGEIVQKFAPKDGAKGKDVRKIRVKIHVQKKKMKKTAKKAAKKVKKVKKTKQVKKVKRIKKTKKVVKKRIAFRKTKISKKSPKKGKKTKKGKRK